jgi:hypothetical protein
MNAPSEIAGASFLEASTRSTAKRLRRTRQRLGSYRHDLIIAMRVVNNVERDMLQAEWENWLFDENARCRQAEALLRENTEGASNTQGGKGPDARQVPTSRQQEKDGRLHGLKKWHAEYCSSCKSEQDRLLEERQYLTFG